MRRICCRRANYLPIVGAVSLAVVTFMTVVAQQ